MGLISFRSAVWASLGLFVAGAAAGYLDDPRDRSCKGEKSEIPEAPFKLRYKFSVGREHGCSQSMESLGEVGDLTIEVDAKDRAVLRLDLFHAHTFGPSYGEFKRGQRNFAHNDSRLRAVWTGKAERTETGLLLQFSKKEISTQLWGSDFEPERTEKSGLTLACQVGTLLLDRPHKEPEPPPECAPVVLCKPSVPILNFKDDQVRELSSRLYYSGNLPFAPHPGLDASVKQLYDTGWDYLRKAAN